MFVSFCSHINSLVSFRKINECRFTHRAPDYGVLVQKVIKQFPVQLQEFPRLMDRYLRVSAVMQCKGIESFVHAKPAAYRILDVFSKTFGKF